MTKLRLIAIGIGLLIVAGGPVALDEVYHAHQRTKATQVAGDLKGQENAAIAQEGPQDAAIKVRAQKLTVDEQILAKDQALAAAIRAKYARQPVFPSSAVPGNGISVQPSMDAVLGQLDVVIADQGKLIADQKAQIAALQERVWTADKTEVISQAREKALETVIADTPTPHPLAVGLLHGTAGTNGVWIEYDLRRLRIGTDLTTGQMMVGTTQQHNVEMTIRLGWRF
jgi:hypothetical protein